MEWLQKVETGVQANAAIVETTSDGEIKPDYDDGADAHAEMSVYFIKANDLIQIICNGKIPTTFVFRLKRDFCLYTYDARKRAFEQIFAMPEDIERDSLFIRYDQCFRFMHLWLEQMIAWRKSAKLPTPSSVVQTRCALDATGDAASLLDHIIELEAACRDASNADHPHGVELASPNYIKQAKGTSYLLFKMGLRYKTLKKSAHELSRLERFPLVSFVFEGFLLLNQNVLETIRRPFVQMHVILPRFDDLALQQQLNDIDVPKKDVTPTSNTVNAATIAEAKAIALIASEQKEIERAAEKRQAKKDKRARRKGRKVGVVGVGADKQEVVTTSSSMLRPDADEFIPRFTYIH